MTSLRSLILASLILFFAISFAWSRFQVLLKQADDARDQLPALREQVQAARATLAKRDSVDKELLQARQDVATADLKLIAPADDPYEWARTEITPKAAAAGIQLLRVSEASDQKPVLNTEHAPWLGSFRLSLQLSGTEAQALRFVRLLEEDNPCIQVYHLTIASSPDTPPILLMTLEWPIWASREKIARVRSWREQT